MDYNFDYKEFKDWKEIEDYRGKIYDFIDEKLDLFDECLEDVGLTQPYPFLDARYNPILKHTPLKNLFPKIYPIDKTEEMLMRNSVKMRINKLI